MPDYNPSYISVPSYFLVGVKTIVVGPDGKILMLKRSEKCSRPHGWDFTGGSVDKKEDPAKASVRETKEETDIDSSDPKPLTTYIYTKRKNGKAENVIIIGYCSKTKSNKVRLTWEHEDYQWMDASEAQKLKLPKGHHKFLKVFLKQNK